VSALRSCFLGRTSQKDATGRNTLPGRYYFIPPGMERWTVPHSTLDPPFYWPFPEPDPDAPHLFVELIPGTWSNGVPPVPYPPGCVRFPERLWPGVPGRVSISSLCGSGCFCGAMGPLPRYWFVDLRHYSGTPGGPCWIPPAVYQLPVVPGFPCRYRQDIGAAGFVEVQVASGGGGSAAIALLVKGDSLVPGSQTYQLTVPEKMISFGGKLPRFGPGAGYCPLAPDLIEVRSQNDF